MAQRRWGRGATLCLNPPKSAQSREETEVIAMSVDCSSSRVKFLWVTLSLSGPHTPCLLRERTRITSLVRRPECPHQLSSTPASIFAFTPEEGMVLAGGSGPYGDA